MSNISGKLPGELFAILSAVFVTRREMIRWTYLQTKLTSVSWDGDAKSGASGIIDLSAAFGVPAGAKAVICNIYARGAADVAFGLGPNAANYTCIHTKTQVANRYIGDSNTVPCDANGDIYFFQDADLDAVYLEIYGYGM